MFDPSVPWWEFVLRAVVVYVFLFAMLRLTGKRQVGQLAPFDLILLLILSNAVQNSMNAGDNSLVGGLVSASTLILINWLVGYATYRSSAAERLLEGEPLVLVMDGKPVRHVLNDEKITYEELIAALRHNGTFELSEVKLALLETNGTVSVWKREPDAAKAGSPAS